jgi:hypothetical protein
MWNYPLNDESSLQLALGHWRKATAPVRDESLLVLAW